MKASDPDRQTRAVARRMALVMGLAACVTARAAAPAADGPMPVRARAAAEVRALGEKLKKEIGRGLASWYGPGLQGRRTASGERFDANAFTAAHPLLPFGTRVRVRNPRNGREVVVRINDRGPLRAGRIIDLSKAAAQALGLLHAGAAPVILTEQ